MLNVLVFSNNSENFLRNTISSIMNQKDIQANLYIVDLNSSKFNYVNLIHKITEQRKEFVGKIIIDEVKNEYNIATAICYICDKYRIDGDIFIMQAGDVFLSDNSLHMFRTKYIETKKVVYFAPLFKNCFSKKRMLHINRCNDIISTYRWSSFITNTEWLKSNLDPNLGDSAVFDLLNKAKDVGLIDNISFVKGEPWAKRKRINVYEYEKYINFIDTIQNNTLIAIGRVDLIKFCKNEKRVYAFLKKHSLFQSIYFFHIKGAVKKILLKSKKFLHVISSWINVYIHFVIWYFFVLNQRVFFENTGCFKYSKFVEWYCMLSIPVYVILHILIDEQDYIKKRLKW